MSKLTKKIEEIKLKKEYSIKGAVKNFMAGVSYKIRRAWSTDRAAQRYFSAPLGRYDS